MKMAGNGRKNRKGKNLTNQLMDIIDIILVAGAVVSFFFLCILCVGFISGLKTKPDIVSKGGEHIGDKKDAYPSVSEAREKGIPIVIESVECGHLYDYHSTTTRDNYKIAGGILSDTCILYNDPIELHTDVTFMKAGPNDLGKMDVRIRFIFLNVDDSVANDVIVKLVFTISPIKNATKEIRLSVAPSLIYRHKDCTDCCFMHFDGCKYRDVNHTKDCTHTSDLIWYNVFDYDVNLFGGRSAFNCVIKKINLEFLSGKTQEISGAQIIRLGDPWKI